MPYCSVLTCPYNKGAKDSSVRYFASPKYDPVLRNKWVKALKRDPGGNFHMCNAHFNVKDLCKNGSLKKGAVPVIKVQKPKMPEDPTKNEVKLIDIEAIKMGSIQPNLCQSCINYDVQLQAANAKITLLERKVTRLTTENKKLKADNPLLANSKKIENNKRCSLCEVELTEHEFEQHLCLDQESIICPSCPRLNVFTTTVSFLKHVLQHTEMTQRIDRDLLYKCDQCNMGYRMEILLECHKKSHEDFTQQFTIMNYNTELNELIDLDETSSNDYSFLPESLLTVEINESVEPVQPNTPPSTNECSVEKPSKMVLMDYKFFKCGLCDMSFELAEHLASHMHEKHAKQEAKENFQCYLCKANFSNTEQLRGHMKLHKRNEKCEVCREAFTLNELSSHFCGKEASIRCEYCPNEYTVTLKLLEHLTVSHEKRKFYQCEKCPKFFSMIALKDCHMKIHEQDEPKQLVCKICSKVFGKKKQLKRHMKSHDDLKPYLCEDCGKRFKYPKNLECHKMSSFHQTEGTYQCPLCPKKFFRKSRLDRHSEFHRGDKYVCEICQTELLSKLSYKGHMKIHRRTEADRRFQCMLCPQKFFDARSLKKHQLVHTDQKLFQCEFCSQSYKYSGDLNKHLKTHLGNEIYECSKCLKRFQYPMELQKHEFEHYQLEKETAETME